MVRQITCPSCGAPLQIASAFTTAMVCSYCGASLAIHDSGVDLTGKIAKLAEYPSRLSVGVRGRVKGRAFRVLGRVRYQYADGFWDEWFVQFDDQQVGWIEEDESDLTLIFKTRLTSPIPPFDQVRVGSWIPLGKDRMFVSEKGQGQVLGAEGEVSQAPSPGQPIQYIDGNEGTKAFRLVIDEHGITLHTGEPFEFQELTVESS
jgi:hypothetical protein